MIEIDEGFVPSERGWKSCGIQTAADFGSSTFDVTHAVGFSCLIIERSKSGQACSFFTGQGAELGHPDDEGKSGALSNAFDTGNEIQPRGEIGVLAQALEEAPDLRFASCRQALDLEFELGFEGRDGEAITPSLEASSVFFDLLD